MVQVVALFLTRCWSFVLRLLTVKRHDCCYFNLLTSMLVFSSCTFWLFLMQLRHSDTCISILLVDFSSVLSYILFRKFRDLLVLRLKLAPLRFVGIVQCTKNT
uniref:Putative product n=1 Tax=Xenopsylla cheopis TaxID=163159 RepID=A0A6M2DV87_XENCH